MALKSIQETRELLIRAGADALADVLLRLAARHDEADAAVRLEGLL